MKKNKGIRYIPNITGNDIVYNQAYSPQMGGCSLYGTGQQGGIAFLPLAAAAYAALSKFQPFSKADKALSENVPNSKKGSIFYKIPKTITGVGKSLGFGQTSSLMGPITYGSTQFQPNLSKKPHVKKRKSKKK